MTIPTRSRPLKVWVSEEPVTARALWRTMVLLIFITVLLFVLVVGLEIQIVRRNAALDKANLSVVQLHQEVVVLGEAVTETRRILSESVALTPEEADRYAAVTEALRQIGEIRAVLCSVDDPVRQEACAALTVPPAGP